MLDSRILFVGGTIRLTVPTYVDDVATTPSDITVTAYKNGSATGDSITPTIDHYGTGLSLVSYAPTVVQGDTITLKISATVSGTTRVTVAEFAVVTPQTGDAYARLGEPAGASIAADIAALGTGTGPNQVNVTVSSSAGGTLQGVSVRMKAAGLGDHTATTDASGVAQFNLASGSWSLTAALNGYSYAGSTQVVSTNPQSIAITLTATTVSVPSGPNKSIGTLLCLDSGGDPESGVTVSFQMIAGPGDDGYSLDAEIVEEECNSEGVIEREFLRGATYDAWRGVRGARARFTVPDAASFNLPEHLGVD